MANSCRRPSSTAGFRSQMFKDHWAYLSEVEDNQRGASKDFLIDWQSKTADVTQQARLGWLSYVSQNPRLHMINLPFILYIGRMNEKRLTQKVMFTTRGLGWCHSTGSSWTAKLCLPKSTTSHDQLTFHFIHRTNEREALNAEGDVRHSWV